MARIIHSGNDGGAVRTRPRSVAGAITFSEFDAPTKDSGLTLPESPVGAILLTLSVLLILAPDLLGELARGKDRIQNYCEQDYPASGCQDRKDQAASSRH
jgi:hypothetical protein